MKQYIFFFILFFFITSCSKEVSNNQAIKGTWKPYKFELSDYDGLKHYPENEGTLSFTPDSKKSQSGTYHFNLHFDFNGQPKNYIETGTYTIQSKNNLFLTSSTGEKTEGTVVYTTKKDFILNLPSVDFLGYYFVMRKQK